MAHAVLTKDFALAANDGTGQIVADAVRGFAGEQLPGSPKFSTSESVNYARELAPDYLLTLSVNHTYRSHSPMGLAAADGSNTLGVASAYGLWNLSTSLAHGPWTLRLSANNVLDKRAILAPPDRPGFLNNLSNDYQINRPRVLGATIIYDFR
jgi:outer membrane receptor protein involved in Fe transport